VVFLVLEKKKDGESFFVRKEVKPGKKKKGEWFKIFEKDGEPPCTLHVGTKCCTVSGQGGSKTTDTLRG